MHLTINETLLSYIPRNEANTYELLKQDITDNGIKQPIEYAVLEGKNVIIDGHTRYQIAEELELDLSNLPTKKLNLTTLDEAKHYMLIVQLSRRNLDRKRFNLFIGELYEIRKKTQGCTGSNQYTAKLRFNLDDIFPEPDKYNKDQKLFTNTINIEEEKQSAIEYIVDIVSFPHMSYVTKETAYDRDELNKWLNANLSVTETALLRAVPKPNMLDAVRRIRASFEMNEQKVQIEPLPKSTAEQIADEFGVSKSTVKRAAKQVKELNELDEAMPGLKERLIEEKASAKKIAELANELNEVQIKPSVDKTPFEEWQAYQSDGEYQALLFSL